MRLQLITRSLLAAALLLTLAPATSEAQPRPPCGGPRWGQQSDESLGLGRGMGHKLMTEEEWQEHCEKMRALGPDERQRYRQEWHQKMVERASERGITLPATPGPHRGGPGGAGQHRRGNAPVTP